MNSSVNKIIISAGVVILVFLSFIVLFRITRNEKNINTIIGNKASDDLSSYSWRRYENMPAHYSVSYPIIDSTNPEIVHQTDEYDQLTFRFNGVDPRTQRYASYSVGIISSITSKTVEEYVNEIIGEQSNRVNANVPDAPIRYSYRKDGIIQGLPYIELYGVWGGDGLYEQIYLVREGRVYEFSFLVADAENETYLDPEVYNRIAWQIVNSIQFFE